MPDLLTEITEIVTGLGSTGIDDVGTALAARPSAIRNVTDAHWTRLQDAFDKGAHSAAFATAWANGRALFESPDGLRGRPPMTIEWKGVHQPPGFEFLPVDLRIDHVYLVSCKYQSKILANSSPSNLFLRRFADRTVSADNTSWYERSAPAEYHHFYDYVRRYIGLHLLPPKPQQLTHEQVRRIRAECGGAWPQKLAPLWAEFSLAVATASAVLWNRELQTPARREEMLWRLLRLSSASYFVLGSSESGPLRVRIGTPWDWRQNFSLRHLRIAAEPAGQPKISWSAQVLERSTGSHRGVDGHVEIRWAHGRFSAVEAKIYLGTPHADVPGYFALPT